MSCVPGPSSCPSPSPLLPPVTSTFNPCARVCAAMYILHRVSSQHCSALLITAPQCTALCFTALYHHVICAAAPYLLEPLAEAFASEPPPVRLALLTAAATLFFARPPEARRLLGSCLAAGVADTEPDVRDRALLYYR